MRRRKLLYIALVFLVMSGCWRSCMRRHERREDRRDDRQERRQERQDLSGDLLDRLPASVVLVA